MSCAVTRSRPPACRTLPSRTDRTPSFSPIARTSSALSLNANEDVRAATRSASTFVSAWMISSLRPSLRYSLSFSWLRFRNGSTAIDGPPSGARAAGGAATARDTADAAASSAKTTSRADWNRRAGSFSRQWAAMSSEGVREAARRGERRGDVAED